MQLIFYGSGQYLGLELRVGLPEHLDDVFKGFWGLELEEKKVAVSRAEKIISFLNSMTMFDYCMIINTQVPLARQPQQPVKQVRIVKVNLN